METLGSQVRHRKRAWRSWLWNGLVAGGMLIFSFLGLLAFTEGRAQLDTFGWVLYSLLFVGGLAGAVVGLRLGLVATAEGIVCRELLSTKRISWADVESVTCKETGGWLVFPLYAPVIVYQQADKDGAGETVTSAEVQVGSLARWGLFKGQSVAFRAAAGLAEELARYRAER
jgi:hypothetical protein